MTVWYFLFFRLLNFFLIMCFAIYGVKKYLISYIREKIEADYKEQEALREKAYGVKKNEQELLLCRVREKRLYDQLCSKIALWRAIVEQKHTALLEQKELIIMHLCEQKQKERYDRDMRLQLMLTAKKVLMKIEKEIEKEYGNDVLVRQFTQCSIDKLYNEK